jgi:hypothetical protein
MGLWDVLRGTWGVLAESAYVCACVRACVRVCACVTVLLLDCII